MCLVFPHIAKPYINKPVQGKRALIVYFKIRINSSHFNFKKYNFKILFLNFRSYSSGASYIYIYIYQYFYRADNILKTFIKRQITRVPLRRHTNERRGSR